MGDTCCTISGTTTSDRLSTKILRVSSFLLFLVSVPFSCDRRCEVRWCCIRNLASHRWQLCFFTSLCVFLWTFIAERVDIDLGHTCSMTTEDILLLMMIIMTALIQQFPPKQPHFHTDIAQSIILKFTGNQP